MYYGDDLYKSILVSALSKEETEIRFVNLGEIDPAKIVEQESCKALAKIRAILTNKSLEDEECCEKIEKIVCLFEELEISCGGRHDF